MTLKGLEKETKSLIGLKMNYGNCMIYHKTTTAYKPICDQKKINMWSQRNKSTGTLNRLVK